MGTNLHPTHLPGGSLLHSQSWKIHTTKAHIMDEHTTLLVITTSTNYSAWEPKACSQTPDGIGNTTPSYGPYRRNVIKEWENACTDFGQYMIQILNSNLFVVTITSHQNIPEWNAELQKMRKGETIEANVYPTTEVSITWFIVVFKIRSLTSEMRMVLNCHFMVWFVQQGWILFTMSNPALLTLPLNPTWV